MQLTVALCTYNPKPQLLLRVIEAIISQIKENQGLEFLVIDNNSTPPLQEGGLLSKFPLKVIREPKQGLTAAREAAIANAKGEIILFVDDDNILDPGYIEGVLAAFRDEKLGLLGGAIYPEYESSPPPWFFEFENLIAIRRYAPTLSVRTVTFQHSDFFPVGAGFAVRTSLARSYVEDCNADIRIEGRRGSSLSSGEDIDLALYVLNESYSLFVTGALRLVHVIPAARISEEYIRKLVRAGLISSAEIERKWRRRTQQKIFPLFSWPKRKASIRAAIFLLLSPLSARFRIKRELFSVLAQLLDGKSSMPEFFITIHSFSKK